MYEKAFVTGCDKQHEWLLPWFIKNYRLYNSSPLVFADFGICDLNIIHGKVDAIIDLADKTEGWNNVFKKPEAMLLCPSKQTVWIDTDCEILTSIEGIWKLLEPNKLNMVEDKPWTKRRPERGAWYNSGVVGFIDKPQILRQWAKWIGESNEVGDQEVLYARLDQLQKLTYINPLPNEYNWLRLQLEHDEQNSWNKKIIHWTGRKGKDRIREIIGG